MKNLLKEKLIRIWQFIKAQKESYRTTIFANKIKQNCDKIEVVFVVYFSEVVLPPFFEPLERRVFLPLN